MKSNDPNIISKIISKELSYLKNSQNRDGGFKSFSSENPFKLQNSFEYQLTFPTSLIAFSLKNFSQNSSAKKITERAVNFLLSQTNTNSSVNYWARNTKESKNWPDDIDDTFCAMLAINSYDKKLIDGKRLAKLVTLLTLVETKEGGPYKTWLVDAKSLDIWKDIDVAVNSNVGYFLALQKVYLKNIEKFIEKSLKDGKLNSPYYPNPLTWYFVSRFYQGKQKDKLVKLITSRKKDDHWGNAFDTALSLLALFNLGQPLGKFQNSLSYLINEIQRNKDYKYQMFCVDPAIKDKQYYAISPALVTAFCIEILQKYLNFENGKAEKEQKKITSQKERKLKLKISKKIKQRFSSLGGNFRIQGMEILENIINRDKDGQIMLLPYFFYQSLNKKFSNDEQIIIDLGTANTYGWIAHTIYDDFYDQEESLPLLPIANFCLREMTSILIRILAEHKTPSEIFSEIMDKIDTANSWELENARVVIKSGKINLKKKLPNYKDYSNLSNRSIGHAITPIILFLLCGYTSEEIEKLKKLFKHYIVARQLNDDMHDWEKDLQKGQINSVATLILKEFKKEKKHSQEFSVAKNLEEMQEIFWTKTVKKVCRTALDHIERAEEYLSSLRNIQPASIRPFMILPIKETIEKTLTEQQKVSGFIKAYK